jgi:NitT/TauT family transport system substrate-binding protein
MSKKSPLLGLFLAIIICLTASCSGTTAAPAAAPLRVEWTLWQGDYTLLVANQMGFFKQHGVNVEPVRYDSSTQAVPDLAGAKLDGGILTMSDTLLGSSLANIKAVMVSDNGGEYAVVTSPDIQSVSDLRGKRIGLNLHTSGEMFVYYMLQSARLTPDDVTYVEMSPNQVLQNIPGQIDAGLVWEPYITQALAQGKKIVFQSDLFSILIPRLVVFRESVIEQRPNDIRAFVLAWDEAVQYRNTHPKESLALISKATGLPTSDLALTGNRILQTINSNVKFFANSVGTDSSSIYYIARFNQGFLEGAGYLTILPDINALLDPSFLK